MALTMSVELTMVLLKDFDEVTSSFTNGKKVSTESERYQECPFGYSGIVHTDIFYVLSLSCLAMGINLVRDKGPRD